MLANTCADICNSKIFYDLATAGKRRRLSTVNLEHNLFQQKMSCWDVEIQNTYIVLLKAPRDAMQISMFTSQFCLGSEPIDWYRDATPVLYGQLWIHLSPRADD